jgi:hypothetical protein
MRLVGIVAICRLTLNGVAKTAETKIMPIVKTTLAAFGLFILPTAAICADAVHWTAPGWYAWVDVEEGTSLIYGPVADEPTCKAKLPHDTPTAIYYCVYLANRSDWEG